MSSTAGGHGQPDAGASTRTPLRILFVSGTSVGGAARSTIELAEALASRGHEVGVLLADDHDETTLQRHKRLLNLQVKLARNRRAAPAARVVDAARRRVGHRPQPYEQPGPRPLDGGTVPVWHAAVIENALPALLRDRRPQLVVANSLERTAWRRIRSELAGAGIVSVLYLREASGVRHLVDPPAPPDVLLANAEAHAEAARAAGFACEVIPSLVDTSRSRCEPSRERVLLVNPIGLYGVDRALELAHARPDIPFAFAESWPIPTEERRSLEAALRHLPNVQLRAPVTDPRLVYRDARVLLMLCTVPSRPRVIAEAQANGIPVLATDLPGHGEAVGDGGELVALDAPLETWLAALDRLWDTPVDGDVARRAREHAARADMSPAAVTARFEAAATRALGLDGATGLDGAGAIETAPSISVVIPAHNAAATLDEQLDAVLAQEYPDPFEVIVVNNRSTDHTAAVVARRHATDPRVRLIDAPRGAGPSYARNTGILAARAEAIACCDADDVVAPGWLAAIGAALAQHPAVAGVLEVDRLNDPTTVAGRGTTLMGKAGSFEGVTFAHGCNMGMRRDPFLAVGGLDERLRAGEEIDLAIRWLADGITVQEVPQAVVHYRYRTDERDQWNQAFEGGRVKPHLCRALRRAGRPSPGRLAGWRNWLWLIRHMGARRDPAVRVRFRWILAGRCGQLAGCVRHRTLYL